MEGLKGGTEEPRDGERRRKLRNGGMEGEVQKRRKEWRKEWKV